MTEPAPHRPDAADRDYSLMRGGPTWRAVRALSRMLPRTDPGVMVVTILLAACFVPLVALAWRDGTLLAGRVAVPLAQDWFSMARFLVAMPLLVLAARFSDGLLGDAMRQLFHGGAVAGNAQDEAMRILARARRARDAFLPELACLALAFAPVFLREFPAGVSDAMAVQATTWQYAGEGGMTAAGAWAQRVSAPLFRFVVLLWLWRLLLWTWLLWRLSRTPLDLRPAHPDRAGGLAFLGLAQCQFAVLSAAGAAVVCGYCLNLMVHGGQSAYEMRYLLGGYAIGSTLALLAPLLLLSPALARAKRAGLIACGTLGHGIATDFDARWNTAGPVDGAGTGGEAMLDSPHPSALADFGGCYATVAEMAIVPVNRWDVLRLALAALVPFVPLMFFAMSLDELTQHLFRILV